MKVTYYTIDKGIYWIAKTPNAWRSPVYPTRKEAEKAYRELEAWYKRNYVLSGKE